MRYVFIIGFLLMIGAQWFVPLNMIFESERTIEKGVEYKFRTAPVDPSDPFRGKYITLDFQIETYYPKDTSEIYLVNSDVYAMLETDSMGFASIKKLTRTPPGGSDYIRAKFDYTYEKAIFLSFPFNSFYLEESKASEAEQVYWQSGRDTTIVCYAKVKVLHGDAKVTDVIINDSSIVDVVRRINANKD